MLVAGLGLLAGFLPRRARVGVKIDQRLAWGKWFLTVQAKDIIIFFIREIELSSRKYRRST
jgi:hypothetical protein